MRLIEFLEPLYEGAKLSRKDIANILAWFRMGFEAEFIYENGFTVHRMNKVSLEDWDNLVDIIELKGGTSLIEVARVLIHNWDQFLKDYNSHQNIGLSPLHPRLIDKIKQGERTRDLPYLMSLLDSNVEMVPMGHALMRIKGVDWVMNNLRFSFKHAVQQDEDGHYMTVVPSSKKLFRKLAEEFEEWFGTKLYQKHEYLRIPNHQRAVWRVMEDSTVGGEDNKLGGAEITSPAMDMEAGLDALERMFQFIDQKGHTNSDTGLHIRVSFKQPKQIEDIDWFKVALFMGDERVLSDFDRRRTTYAQTPMDRIRQYFKDQIAKIGGEPSRAIAEIIRQEGFTKLVQPMREMFINDESDRYNTFNVTGFRDHQGRIEFRVWGNDKYERRLDEIKRTLFQFCYAVILGSTPELHFDTYMKKIFKLIRPEEGVDADRWGNDFTPAEKQIITRFPGWIQQRILNVVGATGYWTNRYAVRAIMGLIWFGHSSDKQFRKKLAQAGIRIVQKRIKDIDNNPQDAIKPVVDSYDRITPEIAQNLLNALSPYPATHRMLQEYLVFREKIKPIIPVIDQFTRKTGMAKAMVEQFFGVRRMPMIIAAVASDIRDAYEERKLKVKPKVIFDLMWQYLQALYPNEPEAARNYFSAFRDYMAWAK
jgi:hypothetical protein